MKKLFFAAAALMLATSVSAQEAGEFRFGINAGMNISSANLDADHSSKVGFNAGVIGEYNITENVFVNAGLKYSQRGVKDVSVAYTDGYDVYTDKLKWNPGYIEMPIHAGYRYAFSDSFKGFAEFGPYFAYAVSGSIEDSYGGSVGLYDDWVENFMGCKYNRFEFGLGGAVGIEFSKVQVKAGYDFGVTKIWDVNNGAKNSNFYVGIGYMF